MLRQCIYVLHVVDALHYSDNSSRIDHGKRRQHNTPVEGLAPPAVAFVARLSATSKAFKRVSTAVLLAVASAAVVAVVFLNNSADLDPLTVALHSQTNM